MKRLLLACVVVSLWLLGMRPVSAELANRDAPIIVSHYHLNVTSVAAHRRFWVETLGGSAFEFGAKKITVIRFPGVFLFLNGQTPTGPTRGTTIDHIGFAVPDVPAMTRKVVANGYGLTVGRETLTPAADVAAQPPAGVGGRPGLRRCTDASPTWWDLTA